MGIQKISEAMAVCLLGPRFRATVSPAFSSEVEASTGATVFAELETGPPRNTQFFLGET